MNYEHWRYSPKGRAYMKEYMDKYNLAHPERAKKKWVPRRANVAKRTVKVLPRMISCPKCGTSYRLTTDEQVDLTYDGYICPWCDTEIVPFTGTAPEQLVE